MNLLIKSVKFKIPLGIIVTGLIAIICFSLWGFLAPFSPVIVGFEKKETARAVIYFHKGVDISIFEKLDVDRIVAENEDFHGLKYKEKVEIFACGSDAEKRRFTFSNARFTSMPIYGRIYVAFRAKKESEEGKIHLRTYIKHELSHTLLFHNMSLFAAVKYPGWLMEGIAVYNADQMGIDNYFSKKEVFKSIKSGIFLSPNDFGTILGHNQKAVDLLAIDNKWWFVYSEFACIVDDLIIRYGKEKFILFMKTLLNGHDSGKAFNDTYGIEFKEYIESIKNQN